MSDLFDGLSQGAFAGGASTHAGDIDRLTEGLTDAQRRAVEHRGCPLAVFAGPGTGKTRVLTRRVAHLIATGTAPESIVALTFTNKAADEMRQRLADLVGGATADRVFAGTFHRFGSMLLRRFGDVGGLPSEPDLTDPAIERRVMRDIIREARAAGELSHRIDSLDDAADRALKIGRHLQNEGVQPDEAPGVADAWAERAAATTDESTRDAETRRVARFRDDTLIYQRFDAELRKRRLGSYDDLISLPIRLLERSEMARSFCRDDYRVVLVDEFQDVNRGQVRFLTALMPPERAAGLTVVGDDDQAIYGFRGATDRAFSIFAERYPDREEITLGDNFRSSQAVVSVAKAIVKPFRERGGPEKALDAKREAFDHAVPELVQGITLERNDQIESTLVELISRDAREREGHSWSDSAVICRSNKEIPEIAQALEVAGIPVRVSQKGKQAHEPAVRDLFAWARVAADPSATYAFQRLLLRPPVSSDPVTVGRWLRSYRERVASSSALATDGPPAFVDVLRDEILPGLEGGEALKARWLVDTVLRLEQAAATMDAAGAIREILSATSLAVADLPDPRTYARRVHLLAAILRFAEERARFFDEPRDLRCFLEYYDDLAGADAELPAVEIDDTNDPRDQADGVWVITAHKSKGLEFDTVYVPRIGPRSGYGWVNTQADDDLPPAMDGDERTPAERETDEQRRLFFVACTRAERRLVLLSQHVKSRNERNFYQNVEDAGLLEAASRSQFMESGRGSEAEETTAIESEASTARQAFEGIVARALRSAGEAVWSASSAESGSGSGNEPVARQEQAVVRAVREVAAARAVLSGQDPGGVAPPEVVRHVRKMMPSPGDPESVDPDAPVIIAPTRGPLTLDYSKIRLFLECPLCYYVKHVARLGEAPSTAATLGSLLHRALERYYRAVRDADGSGSFVPGLARLEAIAGEVFQEAVEIGPPPDRDLLTQLIEVLRVAHGSLHDPRAHVVSLEQTLSVPYELDGVTHRLTGRLDRIDLAPDGSPIVIDYKTHPSKAREEPKKDDLQMGVYAELMRGSDFWVDEDSGRSEYWLLSSGTRGVLRFSDIKREKIRSKIDEAIAGILAGRFTVGKARTHVCEVVRRPAAARNGPAGPG